MLGVGTTLPPNTVSLYFTPVFRTADVGAGVSVFACWLMVSIFENAVVHWSHRWRQLVSAKSMDSMELDLVECGLSLAGHPLWAYALIQVEDEVSCINESKMLALP